MIKFGKYPTKELKKKLELNYSPEEKAEIKSILVKRGELSSDLAIFSKYKGKDYQAEYLGDKKVLFNGKQYKSPTGAAAAIMGTTKVNGWMFWKWSNCGIVNPLSIVR